MNLCCEQISLFLLVYNSCSKINLACSMCHTHLGICTSCSSTLVRSKLYCEISSVLILHNECLSPIVAPASTVSCSILCLSVLCELSSLVHGIIACFRRQILHGRRLLSSFLYRLKEIKTSLPKTGLR